MTDLGHLLAGTENGIARVRAGAVPAPGVVSRTVQRVRRRRGLRHTRDTALGVVLAGAMGSAAWWAGASPDATPPAGTPSTSSVPSASPSPTPGAHSAAAPVAVAVPQPVPAGVLDATTPGWILSVSTQVRPGTMDVWTDEDSRTVLHLVSPTGERTTLLHLSLPWTSVSVLDWEAGRSQALVALAGRDVEGPVFGTLDLRTGELAALPRLDWMHQYVGRAGTGDTLWLTAPAPAGVDPERASPMYPPPVRVVNDEASAGAEGDPLAAVPYGEGAGIRLVAAAPDGPVRDLGESGLRRPTVSPDGAWAVVVDTAGAPHAVDVATGERHALTGLPTDPGCLDAGWSGDHEVLVACPVPGTTRYELRGHDVARTAGSGPAEPRLVATTDTAVRDAWPLGDGRLGLGLVVQPDPCDVVSDPAVLDAGVVTPVTGQWGDADHGGTLVFAAGAVHTHLNGCYAGGRSGPQRDVRTDLTTGAVTTFGWLDDGHVDDPDVVAADGWWDQASGSFVVGR